MKSWTAPFRWRMARYRALHRFREQFLQFSRASVGSSRFALRWEERKPCLHDQEGTTGFDRHYFYHVAWAARVLAEIRPAVHVDISSSTFFSAIASAFVRVRYLEFNPPVVDLDNLQTERVDLMRLPLADGSVESLSCMHVIEHVGLGRYGDTLDPEGDLKAMRQLCRVLAPGGHLLVVVPVGTPRIEFNAHRIYDPASVVAAFHGLQLEEFALIPDTALEGGLLRHAALERAAGQRYACGCFHFVRPLYAGTSTETTPALSGSPQVE